MPDNLSPNPSSFNERLHGLDLIRTVSFLAILVFHLTFAFWAEDGHNRIAVDSRLMDPLEIFARFLSFSGFSIVFLSFFCLD
ncbi:MAG: hypothetical protein HC883_02755 [Bdellovibrionaceae bacterium]|nr:hypothetical protein [Pseudobdellovibrionaceae bacterium]